MDKLDANRRSENMSKIRSKNTAPEILLRSLLHRAGYRFRIHRKDLPGTPDIVFPNLRKVIFVHGCFWHQHPDCREGRVPGSRREYWQPKLARNQERDATAIKQLIQQGWNAMTVWECEIEISHEDLLNRIKMFLHPMK
ncbi:very short patch repair endonuclease [Acidicapsa dinghuensis]|uniref:Very short patch repair endonuclease n=1 Tax=Acidicapsa dinghuensis TaxID=2218256 RepID=A0ABW1EMA3_9BACT|nr:DNA mismatch endonuclease Vsr [Acidicapsa dinghuensis]